MIDGTYEENLLSETIPEPIKRKLALWRELKNVVEENQRKNRPYVEKMKEIEVDISANLSIDEGESKSEAVSVDGCATVWKNKVIGMRVDDYSALQNYLTRNKLEFVLRKQLNSQGVQELHRMVMEGEVPSPKSAEFTTYDKLTIRKKG